MKVVNVFTNYKNIGGAEKIAVSLHENLFDSKNNYLMSLYDFKTIHSSYNIEKNNYLKLNIKNIIKLKNHVFISHHRKTTTLLLFIKKILGIKIRVIHVAHNEFNTLKSLTLFPTEIISVSEKVRENHLTYFKVGESNIRTIYNGIENEKDKKPLIFIPQKPIKILYPARINSIKRQIEIVNNLKDKISSNIIIYFAGEGEDENELYELCKTTSKFKYIGFVNISQSINEYDFVMLFSSKEGLPLSLIEAQKYGKPVIANNVGGNSEIIRNNYNGFIISDYTKLAILLNNLEKISLDDYNSMSIRSKENFYLNFSLETMISKYEEFILNNK